MESRLNAYIRDGRVSGTVKDQQIIQGLRIGVDKEHFFVRNISNFYIDQLSFACDVDRKQFVFLIWNVASEEVSGKFKIEWLVPQTSYRAFPNPKEPLILIHNDSSNNESLHFNQVQWLIRTYKPHDCVPLDVASDAQEEDPRIPIVE